MKKINILKEKASKIINSKDITNQKLEEALNKYTEAIDLKIKDKINAILYSNRAWVNLRLERNGAALEDANKAIKWDPKYTKAYYRRGCANLTLCKYEEALIDLENVYKEFPEDNVLIEKIKEIKTQLEKKKKNIKNINSSLKNNNKSEASPEELLDIKFIEEEIKKEENRIKREEKIMNHENEYKSDNSDNETIKKPEYKGKLSLTREWIVDKVIEGMKNKNFMSKLSFLRIILDVINMNIHEPSSVDIDAKNKFYDLLKIFDECGYPSETNPYLFNGDFVDRGSFSVECVITLLCFKLLYPKHFYLARGNHESRNLNKVYGFEQEVISKYDSAIYEAFIRFFYSLTLAHCINHEILVIHGGLFSKDGVTLDDIRKIKRFREVPESGIMCELLWSDPIKINGRHPSNRGVAITFGPDVVKGFLKANKLQKLVRSHECKSEGYEIMGDVITVFSAPNYCDSMGNKGAVIQLKGNKINIKQFICAWHPPVESFTILNNWIFS
jgi:serine/threonine-protein phosphatase 5